MTVETINNEDIFNYYECPKRFLLMKENGIGNNEPEHSIKVKHYEITRNYFKEAPYSFADWNTAKTVSAIENRENILFPVIRGILEDTQFEIKVGALVWENGRYRIILPFLSRSITDRHRTTVLLVFLLLTGKQVPVHDTALYLGRQKYYEESVFPEHKSQFLESFESRFENGEETYPEDTKLCSCCPFWNHCSGFFTNKRSLPLKVLSGTSTQMIEAAERLGIKTIGELLSCPITQDLSESVKGAERLKLKAYAYTQNTVLITSEFAVPKEWADTERDFYFDIEADTFPYLLGFINKKRYVSFLTKEEKHYENVSRSALMFLKTNASNVFHFFEYEKKILSQLEQKHHIFLDNVKLWDVYDILKKNMILPIQHYSLKMVARWLGFHWSVNLEGRKSIRYFRQWLVNNDNRLIRSILSYNEDDCKATEIVKKWIEKPESFSVPVRRLTKEEMHEIIMGHY
jgi:predicted RecB family nuclease